MSLVAPIPRFLLPQGGAIWRTRLSTTSTTSQTIRHASKTPTKGPKNRSKPLVLEKPSKFNPPSHGARLRKDAPRYPGPQLSTEHEAIRQTKKYPNMMPPEGTFLHWFLNSTSIHMYIALGTLFTLATVVFMTNFQRTSPFADMIPPWANIFFHPIGYWQRWIEIMRLSTAKSTAETHDLRTRKVEDVAKRAEYRKAHGLETTGFGGWTAKTDDQIIGPGIPLGEAAAQREEPAAEGAPRRERPRVRKWLGIW